MKTVVLIGDSIRMGYESVVRETLKGKANIVSPKDNGGNSANVLAHLGEWVLDVKPDVVHLNCGLHDLKRAFDASTNAIPLEAYEENLRAIFERIQKQGRTLLIWATTTPVNEVSHHQRKDFDRFEADVLAYNRVAARLATEYGLPVNDLYSVVIGHGRDTILNPDGVHYAPEGYQLLGKAVAATLSRYLA